MLGLLNYCRELVSVFGTASNSSFLSNNCFHVWLSCRVISEVFFVCFLYFLMFTGQIFSVQAYPSCLIQSLYSVKKVLFKTLCLCILCVWRQMHNTFPRSIIPSWQKAAYCLSAWLADVVSYLHEWILVCC